MSTTPPNSSVPASEGGEWRRSVSQSYRSEEVRNVSKVLASLEPGATSGSKLMLAMRFEQSIFTSATSLADYRKRLTKRLKKLQKSYASTPAAASEAASPEVAAAAPAGHDDAKLERELRDKYGAQLSFIAQHADEAVETMREKHGIARGEHLRQHTDSAEQWAVEIGLFDSKHRQRQSLPNAAAKKRRVPREPGYLLRLRGYLEQRVENIRSHVVKLTQPDLFLAETLELLESDLDHGGGAESNNGIQTSDELSRITLALLRQEGLAPPTSSPTDSNSMKTMLERAMAPVPIPRNRDHAGNVRDASLKYLEKIRAASQVFLAYMVLDTNSKLEVRGALKKAHAVAVEGLNHLSETYHHNQDEYSVALLGNRKKLRLEDAWNRVMKYDTAPSGNTSAPIHKVDQQSNCSIEGLPTAHSHVDSCGPAAKRLRLDSKFEGGGDSGPIVLRSSVLLTPGRKTPINLLPALKRKQAELFRPENNGAGTRLRLQFDDAFEMTLYFVPLLVTIRALPESPSLGTSSDKQNLPLDAKSKFQSQIIDGGLPTWTPSQYGLERKLSTIVQSPLPIQRHAIATPSSSSVDQQQQPYLHVLGVSGTNVTVGPLVAKQLEYASAKATFVLRRCFAEKAVKSTSSDFEIEISEGTALLHFLQIARQTYIPDWQDVDV